MNSRSESLILLDDGHQGIEVSRYFSPTAKGFDIHLLEPTHLFESLPRGLGTTDQQEVFFAAFYRFWRNV